MLHVEEPSSRATEARKEEKCVQQTWGRGGTGCYMVSVGHSTEYLVVQSTRSHRNATGPNTDSHDHPLPGSWKESQESAQQEQMEDKSTEWQCTKI
jgi:hypothetical protein